MNKKILILLGISLALNFAAVGFFVGRKCDSVPPQRARLFQKQKHSDFDFMKKAFSDHESEIKSAHENVVKALKSEPVDEQKIKEAFDKADDIRRQVDTQIQSMMLKKFMTMSPEERKVFIDRFERKGKFFGRHSNKPKRPCRDYKPSK